MTVRILQPESPAEREKIYRFLYEIWSSEFNRSMEGMDHPRRILKDDLDETARHFYAVDDDGQILGCARGNLLDRSALPPSLERSLRGRELLGLFGGDKVCYSSHFAVAPKARGRTVASLLIGAYYSHFLREGALIGVSYCALNLLSLHYQLGYRPYTENFRIDVGVRVPVVLCLRDWGYLHEINSPLARLCPKELDDGQATARLMDGRFPLFTAPGITLTRVHRLWARLAHGSPETCAEQRENFFAGLSEEEQRIIGRRAAEVTFSQGEHVFRRGETEPGMGVLLSGCLGAEVSVGGVDRIVNLVMPGEPYGEIRTLGGERRTADLIALEESRAFHFPPDLLERICRADAALGLKISRRMLRTLAQRFVNFTEAVAATPESPPARLRERLPLHTANPAPENRDRPDSYSFESLGDRESELRRLVRQARIGEEMEFAVLERFGLRDGSKVLDLGSGPGITSLLMARRLPTGSVIGVEPERLLRHQAESLIAEEGLADRCRFLSGTGDRIPLADHTVDFSYARFLFQHISNPLEVLAEMRRVTRPGGVVVILDVDDRGNILHPAPPGLEELERRVVTAQAAAGGDRHVGRKLHGYLHETGFREVRVEPVPVTSATFGSEAFFSLVYSFKRQVLQRAGRFDEQTAALFRQLEDCIGQPDTFAMTTVFAARAVVP